MPAAHDTPGPPHAPPTGTHRRRDRSLVAQSRSQRKPSARRCHSPTQVVAPPPATTLHRVDGSHRVTASHTDVPPGRAPSSLVVQNAPSVVSDTPLTHIPSAPHVRRFHHVAVVELLAPPKPTHSRHAAAAAPDPRTRPRHSPS